MIADHTGAPARSVKKACVISEVMPNPLDSHPDNEPSADAEGSPIQIVDYDPGWPELFRRESVKIRYALGDRALLIEHVGSTSVPGLAAKPVIDVLLVVANSADEPAYLPALESAGYVLRHREPHWHEHRMLKGPNMKVNLHVFSAGSPEIERMLLFRDWLRAHPADRELYARTKIALAARNWHNVQHYADAKTSVVEEILSRARARRG